VASCFPGSNSDGVFSLLLGRVKGNLYAVPRRIIEDLMARTQASVTTIDAHMFEKRPRGSLPSVLIWTEAASKTYCKHKEPMILSRLGGVHLTNNYAFRFDDWIYLTPLSQLHSIITFHTCNPWITNFSLRSSA
jgi:hypothetical protein